MKRLTLRLMAALACLAACVQPALAAVCATPGRDGIGIGVTGVVNTYWAGSQAAVNVGAKSIFLGDSIGASTPIASGDLLLIIQMQDAEINWTNSDSYGDGVAGGAASGASALNQTGIYEYVRATSAVSTSGYSTVTFIGAGTGGGLINSYVNAGGTGSVGQKRYQVIRVPQYSNLSLGIGLTASAWDGSHGGVLAVDVAGRLDLNNGTATVSGLGFRGGGGRKLTGVGLGLGLSSTDYLTSALLAANGSKGEGIAGTPSFVAGATNLVQTLLDLLLDGLTIPGGSSGRGAPGNAGGGASDGAPTTNSQNAGGGGGASYGSGGKGGNANCATAPNSCPTTGGHGGGGLASNITSARIVLGGGGGAGSTNGGTGLLSNGFGSSGASGGGLVLIRAGVVAGSGSLLADGGDASGSVLGDGSGGGGGGGGILLFGRELEAGAAVAAYARGGNGGTNTGAGSANGPGGGGGGGYIMSSLAAAASVTGGANGLTAGAIAYGSVSGGNGLASTNLGVGLNLTGVLSGEECSPILEKVFNAAKIAVGAKARLTLKIKNNHATLGLSSAAFVDTYPSGMINAPVPNVTTSCGATVIAAAGTNTLQVVTASVAAAATCTISVDVVTTRAGNFVNTINAGGLVATLVDQSVASLFSTSAPIETVEPLTAVKTVTTVSDPRNATSNPKSIPGALLQYAITIANPSTSSVTGVVVGDALPAGGKLVVTDLGVAGSGPVTFTQGAVSSTLAYTFTSLASTTDSVEFSKDSGATWTYVPVAGADGADALVTNIRITPTGSHAAGGSFTVAFRIRVK